MKLFIAAIFVLTSYFLYLGVKAYRRRRLSQRAFPEEWHEILDRNVPLYKLLPDDLKNELHGHIHIFLNEKKFSGCAGLEITDEIRVTVAAFACILLLNRKSRYYPSFTSIFVYPNTYIAENTSREGLIQVVEEKARLGESWRRGPIVLSWDSVLHGALDIKDGHNVVLHEFAHKLDEQYGSTDGAPRLDQRSHYISWARVMQKEFEALQRKAHRGRKTVMDHYGAKEPAEFFAVLTETFFEKPQELKNKHPELYEEAQRFFNLDPISWLGD